MNTIAPVWDGNETWLVLGGGGLLAAFPLAYGTILSALYAPIIAMLLALIFRGVAFEFRWRDPRHRPFWDVAFSRRLDRRGVRAGHHARRPAAGHRRRRPRLCRRLVRLADAVQRRWSALSLVCGYALLGADLADHEDRGHAAGALLSPGAAARHRARSSPSARSALATPFLSDALLAALVRLAAGAVHRAGAAAGRDRRLRAVLRSLAPPAPRHAVPDGARCSSRSAWPGSASACSPTSCRPRSRSGTPPRPSASLRSCCRARWSWCRSSSPTPAIPTGCSAARPGTRATIDARRRGSGCGSSGLWAAGVGITALVAYGIRFWLG